MLLVVIVSQGRLCLEEVTLQAGWRNVVDSGFLKQV